MIIQEIVSILTACWHSVLKKFMTIIQSALVRIIKLWQCSWIVFGECTSFLPNDSPRLRLVWIIWPVRAFGVKVRWIPILLHNLISSKIRSHEIIRYKKICKRLFYMIGPLIPNSSGCIGTRLEKVLFCTSFRLFWFGSKFFKY